MRPIRATLQEVTEGQASTWEEALRLARAALDEGDLRRSLWLGHRLLLLRLDQRDVITFVGSKTNSAYLKECPVKAPQKDLLQRLTESYEQVIYAHRPVEPEVVDRLIGEVEKL